MLVHVFIVQIVIFAVGVVVLRLLFRNQLNAALAKLRKLQEEALIKETQLTEEIERAKRERKTQIAQGKAEAKKIIEEAKKEAELLHSAIENKARQENKKIISQARDEAKRMKERLLADIEARSVDVALKLIQQVFTEDNKSTLQYRFIAEVISEIDGLDKKRFAVYGAGSGRTARVVSAVPLPDQEKTRLKSVLLKKISGDIGLAFESDSSLISGLRIEIGEFVIDGTLRNRLEKAVRALA